MMFFGSHCWDMYNKRNQSVIILAVSNELIIQISQATQTNAAGRTTEKDKRLLHQFMERFQLSARAYHRILKVARTIADIEGTEEINTAHLTEAIGYRCLDRKPAT